jgi:hypothetical protein
LQEVVVLEVEANAEVVEVAAELEFVFVAFEAVGVAEGEEFGLGDVVAAVGFKGFADVDPGFGQGVPMWGSWLMWCLMAARISERPRLVARFVARIFSRLGESPPQLAFIDLAGAILFFVFDDQSRTGFD